MVALAFFVALERTWLGLLPVLFERPLFLIIQVAVFEIMARNSVIASEKAVFDKTFFLHILKPLSLYIHETESH